MKRPAASAFDPFILVCVLLGLCLFYPLLANGLPQAPDSLIHFYRSALWRWAMNDGVLWPRWHTLPYQGYGYPVLNFDAPLLYTATALSSYVLPNMLAAYKAMLLLACVGYALGMYLWARDVLGRYAALVAAAAYVFATFRFRELYFLGGYSQFLAWAFYPWALFFFHRLARAPSRLNFLGAVLSLAGPVLSHNISAMLLGPLFGVYALGLMIGYRRQRAWRPVVGAAACALALSAIFWLPAIGEMAYTRAQVLTQGHWDVSLHFLRLADFFAPSPLLDGRAANPPLPFNFGRLHLVLAAVGAAVLFKRGLPQITRLHLAFALGGLLVAAFMMLPASLLVWRIVPAIRFAEYPWRLYGVAFLCSSFLAGASMVWLERFARVRLAATAILVIALILAAAPYRFPRPFLNVQDTPGQYLVYEKVFRALGTTAGGEFLTPWTERVPPAPAVGPDLSRVALVAPPQGVNASVVEARSNSLRLRVEMPAAGDVNVAQFYFPGWTALVDGVPAPLAPSQGSGLIRLALPAGAHDVQLGFRETPLRQAADLLALAGLIAVAAAAVLLRRKGRNRARRAARLEGAEGAESPELPQGMPDVGTARTPPQVRAAWREGALIGALVLGLIVLEGAWVGPHTSLFRQNSPAGTALPARVQVNLPAGDKAALIGYDLPSGAGTQGGEIRIRLYWQALQPQERDYASFVQLVAGPDARDYARSDHQHPGSIPTSTWSTAQYVVDEHVVQLPPDMPPVQYRLQAGLYDPATGERFGMADLPQPFHVTASTLARASMASDSSAARFGPQIRLLGHSLGQDAGALALTLFWQADEQPQTDYQVFVHVLDADGKMLAQADGPPVGGIYPTSAWLPGQIISDTHRIVLPEGSMPEGSRPASLEVGLYDLASMQRLPAAAARNAAEGNDAVIIPFGSRTQ